MGERKREEAAEVLKTYSVGNTPLYVVGTFDTGVTVLSQQVRALNFAWAALESELIQSVPIDEPTSKKKQTKVAIVGGGFAGLSVAAALLKKRAEASITIFEERDTLLPLQQGSDSRWLHPRIYDWPGEGSDASVAMLPVLNWRAARASDVVVQILTEWGRVVTEQDKEPPTLYCNARHLQIHETGVASKRLQIEWVGERRSPIDGTASNDEGASAVGRADDFDLVILAIGFGLERDGALSYWRNESIGQPSLDVPRQTFMVSGQGDGAMIDLLRLRISQFRQDRILDELFRGRRGLMSAIRQLHRDHTSDIKKRGLFADLEQLESNTTTRTDFEAVREDLFRRLRRDTEVILHLRVKKLSELFDPATVRISFQNKLLVYFLYKCGGFVPSAQKEEDLIRQHAIHQARVIRRHGTLRDEQLEAILSDVLWAAVEKRRGSTKPDPFSQSDNQRWPGGYFGFPGRSHDAEKLGDPVREHWRKEYLPGPTELLTTAFCSSLAGALRARHPKSGRLRVTLHRAIPFGDEELLQQCCDYVGTEDAKGRTSAAARTFPAHNGTIGLAYTCRGIIRSLRKTKPADLKAAMTPLHLNAASREMSGDVGFVLAIPLLEPEEPLRYTSPAPVIGVIYIDSKSKGFFIDNKELSELVAMTQEFLNGLERSETTPFDRIRNVPLTGFGNAIVPPALLPKQVRNALEIIEQISAPKTSRPFQLNYDYSDFLLVQGVTR